MELVIDKLLEIGVDVHMPIQRLGGNNLLYISILEKFLKDKNYKLLQKSLKKDKLNEARFYAHTLKGVCANLGLSRLEHICSLLINDIHNNDITSTKEDNKLLIHEYNKIINILTT